MNTFVPEMVNAQLIIRLMRRIKHITWPHLKCHAFSGKNSKHLPENCSSSRALQMRWAVNTSAGFLSWADNFWEEYLLLGSPECLPGHKANALFSLSACSLSSKCFRAPESPWDNVESGGSDPGRTRSMAFSRQLGYCFCFSSCFPLPAPPPISFSETIT